MNTALTAPAMLSPAMLHQCVALVSSALMCAALGVERHFHQKNAGVKTHALVGIGACLFTLVSAYGFSPVLGADVRLDPSRIAAQIVSGIGFIGAGVIFVSNNNVRGLTTAASIWLAAALGVACGAGMLPAAVVALLLHFLIIFALGPMSNRLVSERANSRIMVIYAAKQGIMPKILQLATTLGYTTTITSTRPAQVEGEEAVNVALRFQGRYPYTELINKISAIPGVFAVDEINISDLD